MWSVTQQKGLDSGYVQKQTSPSRREENEQMKEKELVRKKHRGVRDQQEVKFSLEQ